MVIRSRILTASLSLALILAVSGPAAAESEIPATYIDAVAEFLASQNTTVAIEEQMTFLASQQIFGTLASQGVMITEPMQAIILDEAQKSFGSKFSDIDLLAELYAPTYRGNLSEAELRELATFWNSSIGKKMLAVNPALSEGTFNALQEASIPLLPILEQKIDARLAEAGITPTP